MTEDGLNREAEMKSVPFVSQQATESGRNGSQAELTAHEKSPEIPGFAKGRVTLRATLVEDKGLEPMTFWLPARRSPN